MLAAGVFGDSAAQTRRRRRVVVAAVLVAAVGAAALGTTVFHTGDQRPAPIRGLVYGQSDGFDFAGVRSAVWRADPDGKSRTELAPGYAPRLSPDGRWIAYLRKTRVPRNVFVDLYVIPASGGDADHLRRYEGLATLWAVAWAPDSRTLVLTERHGLASIHRNGGDYRRLFTSSDVSGYGAATVAPDSATLALEISNPTAEGESGTDIFTITTSGERRRLTYDGRSSAPLWGPDAIVFSRGRELWLMRPDGSQQRQLTRARPPGHLHPVAWSNDGKRILAAIPPTHNGQLWVVEVDDGDSTQLTGWVGDMFVLALDRDATHALIGIGCGGTISPRGRIERFDLATRRRELLVEGPCRADWNA